MLHVTTEVGKVGKREREKRHFPDVHNVKSQPTYRPRGRKFIEHGHGSDMEWVPHNQNIEPELTEVGPDWSSRLRYLPDPENPDYPAAEIWPNNWRSMRPYPYGDRSVCGGKSQSVSEGTENVEKFRMAAAGLGEGAEQAYGWKERLLFGDRGLRKFYLTYKRSDKEWLLDPGLTKVGLRCVFDGVHKSTATSEAEITHTMLYGKGRPEWMIGKRNELPEASPGDKSYQVPEYSPSFHKKGATRALVRYGPARSLRTPDTFIPLVPVTCTSSETFRKKSAKHQHQQDIDDVKRLEAWRPATPLAQTLPAIDFDKPRKIKNKTTRSENADWSGRE